MKYDWVDIDRYTDQPLPVADFYHCDTRDFHILSTDGLGSVKLEEALKKVKPTDLMGREEIVPYLTSIRNRLKKASWMHLVFKGKGNPRLWYKYIRFWKVPAKEGQEAKYLMYYESGGTIMPMDPINYGPSSVDTDV